MMINECLSSACFLPNSHDAWYNMANQGPCDHEAIESLTRRASRGMSEPKMAELLSSSGAHNSALKLKRHARHYYGQKYPSLLFGKINSALWD